MTPLWTSADAAAATDGTATAPFAASGLSIDTRTLQPGDLFVALTDARDGHDFVVAAFADGACAALVTHRPAGVDAAAPLLIVPDVLAALRDLAIAARARTMAKVVGITGSVGKTSTKDMLRAVLAGQGRAHAAEASYNNHWGVPLTLARMPADTQFAVIEIGMSHPGEIAPLARLARLDVAIVTTVAAAHLEAFADLDGIAREKASILEGLMPGGTAILPSDLETTGILTAKARSVGADVVLFGTGEAADYRLGAVTVTEGATIVRATRDGRPLLFKVLSPGRHFAGNALAALACADALGLDPAIAACDIGLWHPPPGRGTRSRIVTDPLDEAGFDLIDDAFNANPASMHAALDMLIAAEPTDGAGRVGRGRRIAILGDMLELGQAETALHEALAAHPGLQAVGTIHCVGPRMQALHEALPRRQRGERVDRAEDLLPRIARLVDAGDIVLVKGSKGSRVSILVDALRKLGQAQPTDGRGTP